ncbi:MAG: SIMPL domain-containing protein [Rhodospirillaceae bacterium]
MKKWLALLLCVVVPAAWAQAGTIPSPAPRAGVVTIEAHASAEVPLDVATITLVTEMESRNPAELAQRINETLDGTLKAAKAESRVSARSGGYRTFPTTDREGRITNWRGRAEILLESRDFSVLSALAGRLSTRMQVGGMSFALSPEARQSEEDRLITQAISRFQSRGQIAAKAFGYAGYNILEVGVNTQSPVPPPRPMLRSAMSAEASPVPVEPGRTTVTVNVSGSVQLTK